MLTPPLGNEAVPHTKRSHQGYGDRLSFRCDERIDSLREHILPILCDTYDLPVCLHFRTNPKGIGKLARCGSPYNRLHGNVVVENTLFPKFMDSIHLGVIPSRHKIKT